MTRHIRSSRLLAGITFVGLIAIGCSSPAASAGPSSAATTPAASGSGASVPAASATAGSSASPSAPASAATSGATVNANTATEQELAAVFAAAGIPNADRWAREVAEYRPYDADPTWAKLRQELAKYNIDPAVLEQILAPLTL